MLESESGFYPNTMRQFPNYNKYVTGSARKASIDNRYKQANCESSQYACHQLKSTNQHWMLAFYPVGGSN
jgi:hypothetical protein